MESGDGEVGGAAVPVAEALSGGIGEEMKGTESCDDGCGERVRRAGAASGVSVRLRERRGRGRGA